MFIVTMGFLVVSVLTCGLKDALRKIMSELKSQLGAVFYAGLLPVTAAAILTIQSQGPLVIHIVYKTTKALQIMLALLFYCIVTDMVTTSDEKYR